LVIGRVADTVLATDFSNWQARFPLAQYANYLAIRKFRLPHISSPKKWKSLFSTCSPSSGAYGLTTLSLNLSMAAFEMNA
jgi:hypothetical protein